LLELFWTDGFPDLTSVIRRVTEKPLEPAIMDGQVDYIGAIREFDHMNIYPANK
jgi:hypothetical protein